MGRQPAKPEHNGAIGLVLPQPQLDAIADACRRPSCSDLDLLVEFQSIDPGDLVQAYFGSSRDGDLFAQIDQAAQIISFRNKLTHEYFTINDQLVSDLEGVSS